jgi:glycosyltransferase involved in cell wall biosynthesis
MPKVSICIPNYNYGGYIGDTIQSILDQTYTDFELVIVDDSSTDNSMDVINSFNDKRLKVHKNEHNLGIAANWNKCLEYAKGEYIAIFHSDDIYHREIIKHEVNVLETEEEVHIVGTRAVTDITKLPKNIKLKCSVYPPSEFMKFLFAGNTLVCPSVMMKKEVYDNIGRYRDDLFIVVDQVLYLRAAVKHGFAKIENFLMFYRQQQEKSYNVNFKDEVAKYKRWMEEYMVLKEKAEGLFGAYPKQDEIRDYYLYYIAKQYGDCVRRRLLMYMPKEVSPSIASMNRALSQMKEKIPPAVEDII